jgi:hypothetical protein
MYAVELGLYGWRRLVRMGRSNGIGICRNTECGITTIREKSASGMCNGIDNVSI